MCTRSSAHPPALGSTRLRGLRPHHLETVYDRMLHPTDRRRALSPNTVYEGHPIIRGALDGAARRGLIEPERRVVVAHQGCIGEHAEAPPVHAHDEVEH